MVAAFSVYYDFGGSDAAPGTNQDVDALGPPTVRFKTADNATIDTSNPITIPSDGSTNYSYWKHLYLRCDTAPDTQVDNVRIYTDGGGFGTGITLNVGLQFPTKNSGSSAGYEVADAATLMTSGHTGVSTQASLFGYTSGSPLTLSISEAGSVINAIGETSNYVLCQMAVTSAASPGNLADETITFVYDEI